MSGFEDFLKQYGRGGEQAMEKPTSRDSGMSVAPSPAAQQENTGDGVGQRPSYEEFLRQYGGRQQQAPQASHAPGNSVAEAPSPVAEAEASPSAGLRPSSPAGGRTPSPLRDPGNRLARVQDDTAQTNVQAPERNWRADPVSYLLGKAKEQKEQTEQTPVYTGPEEAQRGRELPGGQRMETIDSGRLTEKSKPRTDSEIADDEQEAFRKWRGENRNVETPGLIANLAKDPVGTLGKLEEASKAPASPREIYDYRKYELNQYRESTREQLTDYNERITSLEQEIADIERSTEGDPLSAQNWKPTLDQKRAELAQLERERSQITAQIDAYQQRQMDAYSKLTPFEQEAVTQSWMDRLSNATVGTVQKGAAAYQNAIASLAAPVGEGAATAIGIGLGLLMDTVEHSQGDRTKPFSFTHTVQGAQFGDVMHQGFQEDVFPKIDALNEKGSQNLALASDNLGVLGRMGFDLYSGAIDLGFDTLMNFAIPGSYMASMLLRSYGSASLEARQQGADYGQAIVMGAKSAAIEYATEKISGFGHFRGEKGWLDGIVNKGVERFVDAGGSRLVGRLAAGFGSEFAEEATSYALNYGLDWLLSNYADGYEFADPGKFDFGQMAYEGLIGGLLGAAGAGVQYASDHRSGRLDQEELLKAFKEGEHFVFQLEIASDIVQSIDSGNIDRVTDQIMRNQEYREVYEKMFGKKLPRGKGKQDAQIRESLNALREEAQEEAPAETPSVSPGADSSLREGATGEEEGSSGTPTPTNPVRPQEAAGAPVAQVGTETAAQGAEAPTAQAPVFNSNEGATAARSTPTDAARSLQEKHGANIRLTEARTAVSNLSGLARETDFSDPEQVRRLWTEAKQRADSILRTTENPGATASSGTGREIRDYLKGTKIKIDERLRGDVPAGYENLQALRQKTFGTVTFSNTEGRTVDEVYAELADMFPGSFPQDVYSHSDMLERILDAVANERGTRYTYAQSLSKADYDRTVAELTMDLLHGAESVTGETIPTPTAEAQQSMTAEQAREAAVQRELDADFEGDLSREDAERIVDERFEQYGEYDLDKILNSFEEETYDDEYGGEDAFDEYAYYAEQFHGADRAETGDGAAAETAADEGGSPGGETQLPETVGTRTSEGGPAENDGAGAGGLREPGSAERVESESDRRYRELGEQYGTIEAGENPARESAVPRQIDETRKTGETARTIYEAEATPERRLSDIEKAVVDGKFSYVSIDNETLADKASEKVQRDGWDAALRDWTSDVRAGKANENLVAMGATLLNNAGNSDLDWKGYVDLASDYNRLMHSLGRGLAAARILKTLSPEGRLYGIQRSVESMNEELEQKYKDKAKKNSVEIDPKLIEEYRKAETDAERDEIIGRMQQNIADQIPSTLYDKWVSLRYLNMLGNFKTQIRNVLGNVTMMATASLKNHLVRGGLENIAYGVNRAAAKATGGKVKGAFEREVAMGFDRHLYADAWADFPNVEKEALGEKRYSDSARQFDKEIQDKRRIWKNNGTWGTEEGSNALLRSLPMKGVRKGADLLMGGLNAYSKLTEAAMEYGDQIFSRMTYADAMSSWMKAHKVKHLSDMSPEMLERARMFAIQEAQEATFRDTNGVSSWFSKAGRGAKTPFGKFMEVVGEGIMPFRKTPANVLVRGFEYSPLGILSTGVNAIKAIKGTATGHDVINSLSKTFTGTGLAYLGYLLAAAGLLRTKDDDDKLEKFNKDSGQLDYSINIGGKSITLDWLAPDCIPLFMGAAFQNVTADGGFQADDALKILGQLTEPMLEMSMLSGVQDAIEGAKDYSGTMDGVPMLVLNSLLSWATQGVSNSLVRQGEQASEQYRRQSYTSPDNQLPTGVQRKLSQYFSGIPGYDYQQVDYIDAWGRRQDQGSQGARIAQSLFNPANISPDRSTPYDDELRRLYKNGNTGVLPQAPAFNTTVNDTRLTPEEWERYATVGGEKRLELIGDFLDSEEYKRLDDDTRAAIIGNLYEYSNWLAGREIARQRGEEWNDSWDKVESVEKAGVDPAAYLLGRKQADTDESGSLNQKEVFSWLLGSDYSNGQKRTIWNETTGGSTSWDQYRGKHPAAILAGLHVDEDRAAAIATEINGGKADWSDVSSLSNEELYDYYAKHPDQERYVKALYNAKGSDTSWDEMVEEQEAKDAKDPVNVLTRDFGYSQRDAERLWKDINTDRANGVTQAEFYSFYQRHPELQDELRAMWAAHWPKHKGIDYYKPKK